MSSSATHFTLWNSVKVRGQRLKTSSFHTPTPAPRFTEQHYRCRVSLKQLNGPLPPRKDLCGENNTHLIVPCFVPMTGRNTPCYCIFAQYFSSHNGWQRGCCELTVTPPVTCFHMAGVLVYGERLQLTPLTRLDLMRTDGSLSVEWHIKQLCHRSAVEFYAKPGLAFTWRWPSKVH